MSSVLSSGSGDVLAGALLVERAVDGRGGQVAVGEREDPVVVDRGDAAPG